MVVKGDIVVVSFVYLLCEVYTTGDRVALEPGVPCHTCDHCKRGRYNLCDDITFLATPPYDGNLARYHVHAADYCFKWVILGDNRFLHIFLK